MESSLYGKIHLLPVGVGGETEPMGSGSLELKELGTKGEGTSPCVAGLLKEKWVMGGLCIVFRLTTFLLIRLYSQTSSEKITLFLLVGTC